jgi:hypothetical protein
VLFLSTFVDHALWWHSTQFHDKLNLLLLIVSWEERLSCVKLCQDAPKGPDVNFFCVFDSENHLRWSVETRLDVCVDLLISEASWTKVHNLQISAHGICAKDVFWLQIAMDYFMLLQEDQRFDNLHGIIPNLVRWKPNESSSL